MKTSTLTLALVLAGLLHSFAQDNTFYMDDNSLVTIQAGALVHTEGDFCMDANADLDNAGTIELQKNWHFIAASADVTAAAGTDEQGIVIFQNNYTGNPHNTGVAQTIFSPADMLGAPAFYNMTLLNDQGIVDLEGGGIEIKNNLDFSTASQILRTDAGVTTGDGENDFFHFVRVSNSSPTTALTGAATIPGTVGGYVEGRLQWELATGNTYTFPVGVDAKKAQLFDLLPTASANTIIEGSFTVDAGGAVALADCGADITCVIDHGWWNIDPVGTNSVTSYAVRLRSDAVDNCGGTDYAVLKKPDGGTLANYAIEANDGFIPAEMCDDIATTTASVGRHALTSFSDFAIGVSIIDVLPVELLSFTGRENGTVNSLEWLVESEQNASHYDVERSLDGAGFTKIGEVAAQGDLSSEWRYHFDDTTPKTVSYYRLRMVDFDGSYEYSNTVLIQRGGKGAFISALYPVPTRDELHIQLASTESMDLEVEIVDVLGRVLLRKNLNVQSGINDYLLSVGHLPGGNYFLRLGDAGRTVRFAIAR